MTDTTNSQTTSPARHQTRGKAKESSHTSPSSPNPPTPAPTPMPALALVPASAGFGGEDGFFSHREMFPKSPSVTYDDDIDLDMPYQHQERDLAPRSRFSSDTTDPPTPTSSNKWGGSGDESNTRNDSDQKQDEPIQDSPPEPERQFFESDFRNSLLLVGPSGSSSMDEDLEDHDVRVRIRRNAAIYSQTGFLQSSRSVPPSTQTAARTRPGSLRITIPRVPSFNDIDLELPPPSDLFGSQWPVLPSSPSAPDSSAWRSPTEADGQRTGAGPSGTQGRSSISMVTPVYEDPPSPTPSLSSLSVQRSPFGYDRMSTGSGFGSGARFEINDRRLTFGTSSYTSTEPFDLGTDIAPLFNSDQSVPVSQTPGFDTSAFSSTIPVPVPFPPYSSSFQSSALANRRRSRRRSDRLEPRHPFPGTSRQGGWI